MPLQVAQTINLGSNMVLRETDRFLGNLLPGLQKQFGARPIIFWKYNTSDSSKWVKQSSENYIIIPRDRQAHQGFSTQGGLGVPHFGIRGTVGIPVYVNIGSEDSPSKFCGGGLSTTLSPIDLSTTYFGVRLTGTEKPELIRAGRIDESIPGDGDDPYVFTSNNETQLPRNAGRQEVMTAFLNYLHAAETHGVNSAMTASKTLYVRTSGGADKPITDFKGLAAAFPRYFTYQRQFEQEALASLASGWVPAGWKVYVEGRWWEVETRYVGLWEQIAANNFSDETIRRELIDMGYTNAQVAAIRALKGLTMADLKNLPNGNADTGTGSGSGGGGTGSGGGSGGRNPNGTVWTGPEGYATGRIQDITIQRSRNIFFTADETRSILSGAGISVDNSKPIMYQVYKGTLNESLADFAVAGTNLVNQYVFDIVPNEINYGGFGGEWVSIDRVGSFPFIDWKSFKLLQISFQFTIAAKNGPATADGLDTPITDQIEKLQRMAQTPYPVMFYGFDTLLTNQFRYDNTGTPRGVQFVIQDLSISATRRNSKMEITRATANITLQEIPIERTALIGMPRLRHVNKPPDEPKYPTDPEYGLTSDNWTSRPDQTITYPQETVGG